MLYRYYPKCLVIVFHFLHWNPGWNILIWRDWRLLFQLWFGIWCGLCIFIFSVIIKLSEERSDFSNILMFRNKRNDKNMFSWGDYYYTMNANMMIYFPPFKRITERSILRGSTITILLMFIIMCRLTMWFMLLSTTIIAGTVLFLIKSNAFWIIFNRAVLLTPYKYSQKLAIRILWESNEMDDICFISHITDLHVKKIPL